ncbi:MAG: 1-deoxy-D-xylulose-5-phosphate synthase [Firmicutes bacterium]|nr:1-deoxy-D-xylulose-5-phosphate synthase [Bacillota bacterium]
MERILDSIAQPTDLKNLSVNQLNKLAEEIRQELVAVVSNTGGHLASNLGVVELTLALHSVFDSPTDKIIWDVGHQCYVHKLITGRRNRFKTIRQFGGLSGFPKRSESSHDIVETGHSSTSISAGLGMAIARDLNQDDYHVVAVIGDGALTGGMAFEALNHAGCLHCNLTVILNDNEMSIAENVGGLSAYLSRVRTDPKYTRTKQDIEFLLRRIPAIGDTVYKTMDRVKSSLKYLLVSGMIFEELGFTYLGPIDGHNIGAMQKVLAKAKQYQGPVLIHTITNKGKGYKPAELNPALYHGVGPFDKETGELKKNNGDSYTSVFSEKLCALAENDPRIVAITAAMPDGTGLTKFAQRFPGRFIDVGIAEQHAVTLASGLARSGYRPVVAVYSTFLQRAYDQILHDVCLPELPVVFAVDRAGLVGADGETHHGLFDISMLRAIPNMAIMMPKDYREFEQMLQLSVQHNGPIAVRYPRGGAKKLPVTLSTPMALGKGELLRDGRDLVLIGLGTTLPAVLEAQSQLAVRGISAAVINPRFVKPLDKDLLSQTIGRCGRVVVVEEHVTAGGLGSAIAEFCSMAGLTPSLRLLGVGDGFVTHGTHQQLSTVCRLTSSDIVDAVDKIMEDGGSQWQEKKGWT